MTLITNIPRLKEIRQKLRTDMPDPERKLWYYLRNKQLGVKFRRQFSVGQYVLDFYCHEYKLAIEIDGDSHFESDDALVRDKIRTNFLESVGIIVLRFDNLEVIKNIESCVDAILDHLECTPPSLPSKGRNLKFLNKSV